MTRFYYSFSISCQVKLSITFLSSLVMYVIFGFDHIFVPCLSLLCFHSPCFSHVFTVSRPTQSIQSYSSWTCCFLRASSRSSTTSSAILTLGLYSSYFVEQIIPLIAPNPYLLKELLWHDDLSPLYL